MAPDDILTGGLPDRLDSKDDELEALAESIRDYGQQVPVLLRPHPDQPGKFQVVYGRKVICDALSVDKTVISRMLQITDSVPAELIETIGSAPAADRNR